MIVLNLRIKVRGCVTRLCIVTRDNIIMTQSHTNCSKPIMSNGSYKAILIVLRDCVMSNARTDDR